MDKADREYYEFRGNMTTLIGGFTACINMLERNQFEVYVCSTELFKKYNTIKQLFSLKERILASEVDLERRDKLINELLDLMNELNSLQDSLYKMSEEWYNNLKKDDNNG